MTIPRASLPSVRILGSRIHLLDAAATVDRIESWINESRIGEYRASKSGAAIIPRTRQVVATGFHGLMEAHQNPRIHAVLNDADLWVPDGIAPVWLARLRGHRGVVRTPGAEIMAEFLRRANTLSYSSYFYGDTPRTLDALSSAVARNYPGHRIAGTYSPPFRPLTSAEESSIIDRINDARPDVLWVALGLPKQDVWIHERLARLRVPVAIGVGAAFAFIAGTVSRCPQWMGDAGFEWVYRFLREPAKLWRRDLLDGPRFLIHAGLDLVRSRIEPQSEEASAIRSVTN